MFLVPRSVAELPAVEFYGNPLSVWTTALIIFVAVLGVLLLVRRVVGRRLASLASRTETRLDDALVDLLQRTHALFLFVLALAAASVALTLPPFVAHGVRTLALFALLLQAGVWGTGVVAFLTEQFAERRDADAGARMTIAVVGYGARILLYAVILLLILDNFGINVTALVTGLGIGGVAVALAVQNILGDLFAALSIVLDKPFVVGDSIDIGGGVSGPVEHIGLKSTRIRSVSGELVVVSNGDLLKSRIRNFKRQTQRRIVFTTGVTYETSHEQLTRIPTIIREIIAAQHEARFDRSHLASFGDSAITFETVYFVTTADYLTYMNLQQAIYLELYRRFAEAKIEFAYPVRRVVLDGSSPGGLMPPPMVRASAAGGR